MINKRLKLENKGCKFKEFEGITLITLVIAIIILLILAGVTINLSIGKNGLFNKAKQSKLSMEEAIVKEKIETIVLDMQLEETSKGNELTLKKVAEEIETKDANITVGEYDENAKILKGTYNLNGKEYGFEINEKFEVKIIGKVEDKIISIDSLTWKDGRAQVTLKSTVQGTIEYKDNEGNWKPFDQLGEINSGDILTVRVNKGSETTKEEEIEIKDTIKPTEFEIEVPSDTIKEESIIVKLKTIPEDKETGLKDYTYVAESANDKKEINNIIDETYEITQLESGTKYTIYVLAYDNAGNSRKSNIEEITTKPITKFVEISAGDAHSLGIDEIGNLYAWGSNGYGSVGDGTKTNRKSPVKVKEGTKFEKISAGYGQSLAIDREGNLWAWGFNRDGKVGNGVLTESVLNPVQIKPEVQFKEVAAGNTHSLAIDKEGYIWAWGANNQGQLGDGSTTDRTTPTKIKPDTKFIKIGAGDRNSFGIDETGNLWAWGYNQYGKLGDGTTSKRTSPILIKEEIESISVGASHTLALDSQGKLWGWGYNRYGQLLDGTIVNKNTPTQVRGDAKFKSIAAGGTYYSEVIDEEGNLWAVGYNSYGQLGDGTNEQKTSAVKIKEGTRFKKVSTGLDFTLAIDEKGNLWGWGYNSSRRSGRWK